MKVEVHLRILTLATNAFKEKLQIHAAFGCPDMDWDMIGKC